MKRIYHAIATWVASKAGAPAHDPRKCAHCQQPRRLRDKIRVLAWSHDCCESPTAHPLASEMEKGRI